MITALQAEQMTLKLSVKHQKIDYEVYDIQEDKPTLIECGSCPVGETQTAIEALAEVLYETPILTLPYGHVRLYYLPQRLCLVPQDLYTPEANWLACLDSNEGAGKMSLLSHKISGTDQMLCSSLPSEVLHFLGRQYLSIEYVPEFSEQLSALLDLSRSSGRGQTLVYLDPTGLSLAHIETKGIAFLNRYAYVSPWQEASCEGEVIYYLSLMYETLGLSYRAEDIHIGSSEASKQGLQQSLAQLLHEA